MRQFPNVASQLSLVNPKVSLLDGVARPTTSPLWTNLFCHHVEVQEITKNPAQMSVRTAHAYANPSALTCKSPQCNSATDRQHWTAQWTKQEIYLILDIWFGALCHKDLWKLNLDYSECFLKPTTQYLRFLRYFKILANFLVSHLF